MMSTELTHEQAQRIEHSLGVVLARTLCLERHRQTNNGRCVNCISVAETVLVPRHVGTLAPVVAAMLAEARADERKKKKTCGCAWCCATVPPDQRGDTHRRTCVPRVARGEA